MPGEKGAALLRVSYLPCAQAGISTLLASRAGCWQVIGPVPRRTLDISDIGNSIAYIYARNTYPIDVAQRDKKDTTALKLSRSQIFHS